MPEIYDSYGFFMQAAALALFLLALLIAGVLGTETRLLFFWPGAALLGLAGFASIAQWRWRVMFAPSDVCLASTLLFAAGIGVRAWLSPVALYAREDGMILAACVLAYGFTATLGSHPRWRSALMTVLLLLAIGNLAIGSIHLSGNWGFHVVPTFARAAAAGRIGGFFANPNHLAAFLCMAVFLSAGWLCFGRGGAVLKLWLGFLSVSMLVGMALTVSRGAVIGLAAGGVVFAMLALWIVWETQRHLFWRLMIAGILATALGGSVLWKVNEEFLRARMDSSPMSNDVRLGIWEAALVQHAQSPLVGAGSRQFYDGSIRFRSPRLHVRANDALFAHNEFLQMLADYGWIGLGLLLVMLVTHGVNGLRFLNWFVRHKFLRTGRVSSTSLALTLGALAAIVAASTHALFEFQFHVPVIGLTAAVALGLLANPGFEETPAPSLRLPGVRVLLKVAMLLAAIATVAGAWMFGRADYHAALAEVAAGRGEAEAQMTHLDTAIAIDGENAQTLYTRGLARLDRLTADQRGENNAVLQLAAADLEQAVRLNPHSYLYPLALADAYDALGRYDEALQAIQLALRLAPLHEEPRLGLGIHWHRLGQFDKAELAYLWAGQSLAWNEEGTARWIDNYRELLRHAALMR